VKRLLYIEDNRAMQMIVERHLAGLAEISTGASLNEARARLRDQTFDLVLTDVNLPDGNSLDLLMELRRRFTPEQLPVILVSASMDRRLTIRSLQAGANDCFAMPMALPVLAAAVARMLERAYVRPNDLGAVVVTWLEGTAGGQFWVYCPDIDLRLDGADPEAVRQEMDRRVRASLPATGGLPFVGCVEASERLIETAAPGRPR
jgi:DNA-binding response OmpR family regulator